MSCLISSNPNSSHIGRLILRLLVGGLMLMHGIHKVINGIGGVQQMVENAGLPGFFAYGAYIGEVIAPLLIIIGFKMRPAALVLVVQMLFIIFIAHSAELFEMAPYGGMALESVYFYLFGAVALFFLGAGKFSLDKNC